MRVPVDQTFAAIDQALVVHLNKDLDDRIVEIGRVLVTGAGIPLRARHGEGGAVKVAGRAKALQLVDNGAAGLFFPGPDFLKELLAAQFGAGRLLVFRKFAFDNHLGCDACVVGAGLPERVKALHAFPADQDVLQRVVERVAHVQDAGDVRRRDHNAIGRSAGFGVCACGEAARLFPGVKQAALRLGCVKALFQCHFVFLRRVNSGCVLP